MSQENVEVVRRGVEALNARDLDRHYVESFDPEVEWRTSAEDPDAATHRGLQAYKRYLEQWLESFDGLPWTLRNTSMLATTAPCDAPAAPVRTTALFSVPRSASYRTRLPRTTG